MTRIKFFRMKKASYILLGLAVTVVISVLLAPALSASSNPCTPCHASYYQVLDIREGDGANQIPMAINVGETKMVVVVVENAVNTARYSLLSSVSLTLWSKNGHFSVKNPTYSIGSLQPGTQTAQWEITGNSDGVDSLLISATGGNSHTNLVFSDSYLPAPAITVGTPNPLALSIQLTSPVEGESWYVNSTHNISWNSAGGEGTRKVTLEYGTTGTNPWLNIATELSGSGSFAWTVPSTTAQNVYIRATVLDSKIPPNSASTISRIQVLQPQAPPPIPEFPTATILATFMLILVLIGVFFRKMTT